MYDLAAIPPIPRNVPFKPLKVIERKPSSPLLALVEHAGNQVPPHLNNLGLSEDHFLKHYAIDIGTEHLTTAFCHLTGAGAVMAMQSRLVVDVNRSPGDPDLFATVREGHVQIVWNQNMSEADRRWRLETFYTPYDKAVQEEILPLKRTHAKPTIVSLHSFTRVFEGNRRECDIGVLHNGQSDFAPQVFNLLQLNGRYRVADNAPYDLREYRGSSPYRNVYEPHPECSFVLLEVCNDLIDTAPKAQAMADYLVEALKPVLR